MVNKEKKSRQYDLIFKKSVKIIFIISIYSQNHLFVGKIISKNYSTFITRIISIHITNFINYKNEYYEANLKHVFKNSFWLKYRYSVGNFPLHIISVKTIFVVSCANLQNKLTLWYLSEVSNSCVKLKLTFARVDYNRSKIPSQLNPPSRYLIPILKWLTSIIILITISH